MAIVPGLVSIAGVGHTEFSKNSGRSELQLAAEAVSAAIADAGLTPSDVDGLVTFVQDSNDELQLIRSVGMPELRWTARTPFGGGGANATVQLASAAVISGAAKAVVVYRAFNERSGHRFGQPQSGGNKPAGWSWYLPFGLDTPAKMYSLWFQRYMHEFGLTNADFGLYTVAAREYAATNPNAWYYKRPLSMEEHQASRWIVEPILRLYDCCQESDGGVAVVVTTTERARDLPNPVVTIEGATQGHLMNGDVMFNYYLPDLAEFSEARFVADQLYGSTGLRPEDIDVALMYENFSPVVFYQLEAYGFCGRGEARDFIAEGNIGPDGKIPTNTNGGLLGEGYIHGVNNIIEGARQIRGTAANQIPGAEHVLVSAGRSSLILGRG